MKLFLAVCLLSITCSMAFSQGMLDRVKSAAASHSVSTPSMPSLSNISGAGSSIMSKLSPALSLASAQKPTVSTAVTGFLKQKAGIMPLMSTDKAAYTSKFSALQSGLFSKLKTTLSVSQYTKFLSLKPKAPSATNVLSNLFY